MLITQLPLIAHTLNTIPHTDCIMTMTQYFLIGCFCRLGIKTRKEYYQILCTTSNTSCWRVYIALKLVSLVQLFIMCLIQPKVEVTDLYSGR